MAPKRKKPEASTKVVTRRQRRRTEKAATTTSSATAGRSGAESESQEENIIARVTADVTARVSTSLAGLIQQTIDSAVRDALGGRSEANRDHGVDGQALLPAVHTEADDLPLGLRIDGGEIYPAGSSGENNITIPDNAPIPNSFPIDARIPMAIKQKQWENHYIEIGQLLHPCDWDKCNISMTTAAGNPWLCLLPKTVKRVVAIEQWNAAFTIFMSIYLNKFPAEAIPILKHSQTVNKLQAQGGDFIN